LLEYCNPYIQDESHIVEFILNKLLQEMEEQEELDIPFN
jgi:hypothetical protein